MALHRSKLETDRQALRQINRTRVLFFVFNFEVQLAFSLHFLRFSCILVDHEGKYFLSKFLNSVPNFRALSYLHEKVLMLRRSKRVLLFLSTNWHNVFLKFRCITAYATNCHIFTHFPIATVYLFSNTYSCRTRTSMCHQT